MEVAIGVYVTNGKAWGWKHLCVPCFAAYERKVWGKATTTITVGPSPFLSDGRTA